MNADGSGLVNLTNAPASDDFFPKWSADGTQIGFTSARDGNAEIYLMNADGSNQTRLTKNAGDDVHPRWSPDGTKIVFVYGFGDGRYEIYLMNADGSNQTPLTDSPGPLDNNFGARWSADGMQIIFWSERDGNAELYAMNADGSAQTRLTDNPASYWSPMLQP
jgi:Tol biopolymer transport system component